MSRSGLTKTQEAERLRKAITMSAARATWAQIAEECHYHDAGAAYKAVKRWYAKQTRRDVSTAIAMELETLDMLQRSLYAKVNAGDPKAVLAVLKVMEHRAKLVPDIIPKEDATDTQVRVIIDPRLLSTEARQAVALGELESTGERPLDEAP